MHCKFSVLPTRYQGRELARIYKVNHVKLTCTADAVVSCGSTVSAAVSPGARGLGRTSMFRWSGSSSRPSHRPPLHLRRQRMQHPTQNPMPRVRNNLSPPPRPNSPQHRLRKHVRRRNRPTQLRPIALTPQLSLRHINDVGLVPFGFELPVQSFGEAADESFGPRVQR